MGFIYIEQKNPTKNQHHQQVAKIQVFWEDKKNPPKFAMKKNVDFKEDRGQGLAKVLITRPLPYTYCLNFPEFPLKKTVFFYSGHIQFTICFFCCTLRRNSVRKRRPGTWFFGKARNKKRIPWGVLDWFFLRMWQKTPTRFVQFTEMMSSSPVFFFGGTAGQKKKLTQGDRTLSWILLKVRAFILTLHFPLAVEMSSVCVCVLSLNLLLFCTFSKPQIS